MKQESQEPLFEEIPYPEYVLRILFASFYPAVKMAVEFNYPLDTVKDMMTSLFGEKPSASTRPLT